MMHLKRQKAAKKEIGRPVAKFATGLGTLEQRKLLRPSNLSFLCFKVSDEGSTSSHILHSTFTVRIFLIGEFSAIPNLGSIDHIVRFLIKDSVVMRFLIKHSGFGHHSSF
jgi:hypothetical protein